MDNSLLGTRLFLAHNHLEQRLRRKVTYAELGRLVAKMEGRKDANGKVRPYSSGNVNRWIHNEKKPGVETQKAFADVTGVRRAWLVLEEGQMVEDADEGTANGARKLTSAPLTPVASRAPAKKRARG